MMDAEAAFFTGSTAPDFEYGEDQNDQPLMDDVSLALKARSQRVSDDLLVLRPEDSVDISPKAVRVNVVRNGKRRISVPIFF